MRPTHPLQGATAWASSLPAQEGGRLPDLDGLLGVRMPRLLGSLRSQGRGMGPGSESWLQRLGSAVPHVPHLLRGTG